MQRSAVLRRLHRVQILPATTLGAPPTALGGRSPSDAEGCPRGYDRRQPARWEIANRKYGLESDRFVQVADDGTLLPLEVETIAPLLRPRSVVLHLQSGNGTEDPALSRLAGSTVVGVDFSAEAATSAHHRVRILESSVSYVVADALRVPLAQECVDLVYTGKGALMWLVDLPTWASEVVRVLRPGGWFFLYEAHPIAALSGLTTQTTCAARSDLSYFGGTRPNDSFPASAIKRFDPDSRTQAIEWQWTMADVVMALLDAGLRLVKLGEHPEPFWRPADSGTVAAWAGTSRTRSRCSQPRRVDLNARCPSHLPKCLQRVHRRSPLGGARGRTSAPTTRGWARRSDQGSD